MGFAHSKSGILATSIVLVVIPVCFTALRFCSRATLLNGDYRLDDWLALAAVIFAVGQFVPVPILIANGLGQDTHDLSASQLTTFAIAFFAAALVNIFALTCAKLSALAFYVRIFMFRSNPNFFWKITMFMTTFFTVINPLWLSPAIIWKCHPIEKAWEVTLPGSCANTQDLFIASSVYNFVTDIMILLQPLPGLFNLHVKRSRKLLIAGVFAVGYSVPIISLGRLIVVLVLGGEINTNFTRALTPIGYWTQAEPGVAIAAISLPPVYQLCIRFYNRPLSRLTSLQYDQAQVGRTPLTHTTDDAICLESEANKNPADASGDEASDPHASMRDRLNGSTCSGSKASVQGKSVFPRDMIDDLPQDSIRVDQRIEVTYGV